MSRYDGETFTRFTTEDGLANNWVWCMHEDREGVLWFGTWGGGVSRYDGQTFTTYTTADGLGNGALQANKVVVIAEDSEGALLIGTNRGGVARFDGHRFEPFVATEGTFVGSLVKDAQGNMWLGGGDGIYRYDGTQLTRVANEPGLANAVVRDAFVDAGGDLWIGTNGAGVKHYDGKLLQTLTTEDGLAGNTVWSIEQDQEGDMWFATNNGVTRFRPPPPFPPSVAVDAVIADRRHEQATELSIPSTATWFIPKRRRL